MMSSPSYTSTGTCTVTCTGTGTGTGSKVTDLDPSDDGDDDSDGDDGGYVHYNDGSNNQTFTIDLWGHGLTLSQKPSASHLGIGATVWDSSVIMAKYIEHEPRSFSLDKMAGKTVLELGAGCGLAGIALMLRGCAVTFTDLPAVVDELTRENVCAMHRRLGAHMRMVPPVVGHLDWRDFANASASLPFETDERYTFLQPSYDYILLTDCVFSIAVTEDLITTILKCAGSKTVVLCCYEIRDEETNAHFIHTLEKYFTVKKVRDSQLHPQYRNRLVPIVTGKPKKGSLLVRESSTRAI